MATYCFSAGRRRHTRCGRDWSSDVCSSDLVPDGAGASSRPSLFLHGPRASPRLDGTLDEFRRPADAGICGLAFLSALFGATSESVVAGAHYCGYVHHLELYSRRMAGRSGRGHVFDRAIQAAASLGTSHFVVRGVSRSASARPSPSRTAVAPDGRSGPIHPLGDVASCVADDPKTPSCWRRAEQYRAGLYSLPPSRNGSGEGLSRAHAQQFPSVCGRAGAAVSRILGLADVSALLVVRESPAKTHPERAAHLDC